MTRLETPPRGRSMVSMIKTLGERLSTQPGVPSAEPKMILERPTPPLPPTHLKTLQRR